MSQLDPNERKLINRYMRRLSPNKRRFIEHYMAQSRNFLGQILPNSLVTHLQDKMIYAPRIKHLRIDNDRFPLFDTVFFEVRTKCNGACSFCAASIQNDTRQDTEMPKNLYAKIINELKSMQFDGRIAYHVNNDPLIFAPLSEFVEYARQNLPSAWIQILTNGKALTENKAVRLLKAGINELTVNDYNDDPTAEPPKRIQNIYDNVLPRFYEKPQIRFGHGPDRETKNIFRFNVFKRSVNAVKSSRAGTSPNKQIKSKSPRGFCEYPFTQFNITTDGRVSKCCADFLFSDPMGNVKEDTLMDIWKGEKFQNVRRLLLGGNRDAIKTCSACDFYGVKKYYSRAAYLLGMITG